MPQATGHDITFALMAQLCCRPVWEPEIGKRTRRRTKRMPLPTLEPRVQTLYSLNERGEVCSVGSGRVVPTDRYSGAAIYVIDWQGDAVTVCCCASDDRIALRLREPSRTLTVLSVEDLEPHILGRVITLSL